MSAVSRRWLELGVRCPTDEGRGALIVEALIALGGRAAEEREGWYVTHLEAPDDLESFREEASRTLEALTGTRHLELRIGWREHEDWARTWKRGLGFRRITERIAVRPTWVPEPEDAPEVVIVLDPGMAFGTAEHGTTRGCLRLLDTVVAPGQRILDVGAGSGVLSIAAALLGAEQVVALEGDPLACEALAENLEHNGVAGRVRWLEGLVEAGDLAAYGPADGLVANIESGVLAALLPGFGAAAEPGAWLILSGILSDEWPLLRARAEREGFDLQSVDEDGEWRSGLFRRRGGSSST